MITRNTDYSIQRLRGLSTDTKPTDVPNGSEFREMDTGKDFMYDEVSGDWKEQPKKGGGGGGGGDTFSGLSVIRKIELSEPVRSVQIDIPNGVDWVYVLISGGFVAENWLYWALNKQTSQNYQPKTTNVNTGFVLTNNPYNGLGRMVGLVGSNRENSNIVITTTDSPMTFFSIYGYSADFMVGTKIFVYGGKYADM